MYGVETGSQYFLANMCRIITKECAFLAGMDNAPNTYNPFGEKRQEKIKKGQKAVLTKMLELNYIDENAYNDAIRTKAIEIKKTKIEAEKLYILIIQMH